MLCQGILSLRRDNSVLSLKRGNAGHIFGHRIMGGLLKMGRIRSYTKTNLKMMVVLILRSHSRLVERESLGKKHSGCYERLGC